MKKILLLLLIFSFVMPTGIIYAQNGVNVYIDGSLDKEAKGVIVNGSTLVPLRAIFEAMGATVEWNSETKTVISKKDDTTIEITIGKKVAKKNGEQVNLSVPAQIINNSTMVPLRFVGEAFGGEVIWDGKTQSVYINTEDKGAYSELKETIAKLSKGDYDYLWETSYTSLNYPSLVVGFKFNPAKDKYDILVAESRGEVIIGTINKIDGYTATFTYTYDIYDNEEDKVYRTDGLLELEGNILMVKFTAYNNEKLYEMDFNLEEIYQNIEAYEEKLNQSK